MVLTSWSSWVVVVISYCENCASGCSVVHKTPHHGWHTRWCYVNNWEWGCGGGPITFCCLGFFQHALDATHWSNLQHALGAMILSHDTLLMLRSFLSQVTFNMLLTLRSFLSQIISNTLLMLRCFRFQVASSTLLMLRSFSQVTFNTLLMYRIFSFSNYFQYALDLTLPCFLSQAASSTLLTLRSYFYQLTLQHAFDVYDLFFFNSFFRRWGRLVCTRKSLSKEE